MDAALRFLGYSARTVRETERYLDEKQYGEYEISQVIDRLIELGLLNDQQFAIDFVESRLRAKPVSRRHLREQLHAHELPSNVISEALYIVTDDVEQKNARSVAEKYWRQMNLLPASEREERVLQRLVGRGFSYDVARSALAQLDFEEEAGEE